MATDARTTIPPSRDPRVWGIVLAAGTGTRFGTEKQFVTIAGHRPVDLAVATALASCDEVVLVLPDTRRWDGVAVTAVVSGGADRSASVRRGLAAIPTDDTDAIVVVHQAANPLATPDMVAALLDAVRGGAPAAVPGLAPADVVRRRRPGSDGMTLAGEPLGRDDLVLIQTPAAFRLAVLRAAHAAPDPDAQEDTALVSAVGHAVHIVPGDPRNVHMATREDLDIVRALLATRSVGSRADRGPERVSGHGTTHDEGAFDDD